MSKAVERARRVMGLYGENSAAYIALSDLLAEIDAGVWLDARELEALRVEHGLVVAATAITSHGRWIVYDVNNDCAPGVFYATAADAVRATREATGE